MKSWTVEEMIATGACYSHEQITALWAGRERLTLLDVLDLEIPAVDRLCVVWRPGVLTGAQRRAVLDRVLPCGVPDVKAARAAWAAWAAWVAWEATGVAWAAWAAWVAAGEAAEYEAQVRDVRTVLTP